MDPERKPDSWDPAVVAAGARFVSDLAGEVFALLDPRPGERILDLGCGAGALTERIAATGAEVVGVDASPEMVEAAGQRGLDARVASAYELPFDDEFDAVFSNAAMHWMLDADSVLRNVHRSLRPGGRFAAEFGGAGNVATIVAALERVLPAHGVDLDECNPWYFPTPDEYSKKLGAYGFAVETIALVPRGTPVPGAIADWLENVGVSFVQDLPMEERKAVFAEVCELTEADLRDDAGQWWVDYVRLRGAAHRKS